MICPKQHLPLADTTQIGKDESQGVEMSIFGDMLDEVWQSDNLLPKSKEQLQHRHELWEGSRQQVGLSMYEGCLPDQDTKLKRKRNALLGEMLDGEVAEKKLKMLIMGNMVNLECEGSSESLLKLFTTAGKVIGLIDGVEQLFEGNCVSQSKRSYDERILENHLKDMFVVGDKKWVRIHVSKQDGRVNWQRDSIRVRIPMDLSPEVAKAELTNVRRGVKNSVKLVKTKKGRVAVLKFESDEAARNVLNEGTVSVNGVKLVMEDGESKHRAVIEVGCDEKKSHVGISVKELKGVWEGVQRVVQPYNKEQLEKMEPKDIVKYAKSYNITVVGAREEKQKLIEEVMMELERNILVEFSCRKSAKDAKEKSLCVVDGGTKYKFEISDYEMKQDEEDAIVGWRNIQEDITPMWNYICFDKEPSNTHPLADKRGVAFCLASHIKENIQESSSEKKNHKWWHEA